MRLSPHNEAGAPPWATRIPHLGGGGQVCRMRRFRRKKGFARRPEIRPKARNFRKFRKLPDRDVWDGHPRFAIFKRRGLARKPPISPSKFPQKVKKRRNEPTSIRDLAGTIPFTDSPSEFRWDAEFPPPFEPLPVESPRTPPRAKGEFGITGSSSREEYGESGGRARRLQWACAVRASTSRDMEMMHCARKSTRVM